MKLKLTPNDRSAIDLLLGEATAASASPSQGYVAAAGAEHVQSVRQILQLLQVLPAAEPPVDLVSRTLARIGKATGKLMTTPKIDDAADHRSMQRPS